ncbi:Flagellar L-ring protein FlgH [Candidatus Rhodobacter oscarellae]|uniref:Flagellar L-ring protein n=1 Tax=Candidatus Rhodobacter oscarellae TaxID=1675527 RepID=A0A0J9E8U9_9RHOB|nr:flagellar basal body L-ring protein FlgH [Candidatus Rhodobacter lobularis]KMW59207.1 Flagellar L-ring protein FlgH [Candidatus Rhodobacter lobularis]
MRPFLMSLALLTVLIGCDRLDHIGKEPTFTPTQGTDEFHAMMNQPLPIALEPRRDVDTASLWSRSRGSLLGDRRAMQQGDILTVVIEIDEKAEISNSTNRSRSGSESLGISDFFGIPERINQALPDGASLDSAVSTSSSSSSGGDGSVSRKEKLTLRIAATIKGVLPNGVLQIVGRQEVRVNFELRELLVSGYVRPEDISRQNEITYDKIAAARISYGGRGQITDVQQPRYGQQIADIVLPF